jgi:solute carrier family 25 carnitine/acylcarnitine transporter 20/29
MADEARKNRPKWKKALVDIFAGTIAGINVTFVGHPFDTLKIRLQTQPVDKPIYSGLSDCFFKTLKWEGFSGLYKGVQAPLVGQMFFRANLFMTYGEVKRYFSKDGAVPIKLHQYYIAGGTAWGVAALVECPIDFFKTQMQIQIIAKQRNPETQLEFNGMFDCFKKIFARKGIVGCYQGFNVHLMRNLPAGAAHLGSFELIRLHYAEKFKCKVNELPTKYNLLAGSIGGILFWLLFFPIDVMKSSIQADSPWKENRKFKNTIDCYNKLMNEGGFKRFYKGFSPCMMRAVPANAVLLYTSSYISENL